MARALITPPGQVGVFACPVPGCPPGAASNEVITSVTIESDSGFQKIGSMKMNTGTGYLVLIPEKPPGPCEGADCNGTEPALPEIPEPSSLLLLGSGVLGLALLRRKAVVNCLGFSTARTAVLSVRDFLDAGRWGGMRSN